MAANDTVDTIITLVYQDLWLEPLNIVASIQLNSVHNFANIIRCTTYYSKYMCIRAAVCSQFSWYASIQPAMMLMCNHFELRMYFVLRLNDLGIFTKPMPLAPAPILSAIEWVHSRTNLHTIVLFVYVISSTAGLLSWQYGPASEKNNIAKRANAGCNGAWDVELRLLGSGQYR